jgi:CRP/FNR family transcriptional regulator, cyclic AMP receptor protein
LMSIQSLTQLPLFEGFALPQLELLDSLFTSCEFPADTLLFAQGDAAEFLYVVTAGEVVVNFKPDDAPSISVARVRPGGVVGWSAALGSRVYTSGALCTLDCQLLRVRGGDLRMLCQNHPETGGIVLQRLAEVISQRMSNAHNQVVALLEIGLMNSVQSTGG